MNTDPEDSSLNEHEQAEMSAAEAVLARLNELYEQDALAAVEAARHLLIDESEVSQINREKIAAGILVDGGSVLKDPKTVEEGIGLFRRLRQQLPDHQDLDYNLANGLNALATMASERPWTAALCEMRREARSLYHHTALRTDGTLRSRALTNQANLLRLSFRWVEAYDAYAAALEADSQNGVASSGIARLINDCVAAGLAPAGLSRLAARYIRRATSTESHIVQYAGRRALANIRNLAAETSQDTGAQQENPTAYAGFVARHRLALSLSMEEFHASHRFWDNLSIRGIREALTAGPEVPAVFAMWNCLKQDFICARWLAYRATQGIRETAQYSDTLDYANYGIKQGVHVLAQRAAVDVLDKIACCVTEYLGLPGNQKSVYFWNRWHVCVKNQLKSPRELQPQVLAEIEQGNTAVLALADMADDLQGEGFLKAKRSLRHSATHRFVVLHDEAVGGSRSRPSSFVDHFNQSDFEQATIETLQMCRAALTYLVQLIASRERRLSTGTPELLHLEVPPHHWVRGRRR